MTGTPSLDQALTEKSYRSRVFPYLIIFELRSFTSPARFSVLLPLKFAVMSIEADAVVSDLSR